MSATASSGMQYDQRGMCFSFLNDKMNHQIKFVLFIIVIVKVSLNKCLFAPAYTQPSTDSRINVNRTKSTKCTNIIVHDAHTDVHSVYIVML